LPKSTAGDFFCQHQEQELPIPEETGTGQRLPTENAQVVFPPVRSAAASLTINLKNTVSRRNGNGTHVLQYNKKRESAK